MCCELAVLWSNTVYVLCVGSTVMMSMNKHMYQSLAHLIRWADDLLLHNKIDLDKVAATEVIKAVTDGIQVVQMSLPPSA